MHLKTLDRSLIFQLTTTLLLLDLISSDERLIIYYDIDKILLESMMRDAERARDHQEKIKSKPWSLDSRRYAKRKPIFK